MNKIPMMENGCRQLLSYGVQDGRTRCKNLIKHLLLHREMPVRDWIFWPTGLLAAGLWHCRKAVGISVGAQKMSFDSHEAACAFYLTERALSDSYVQWMGNGMPVIVLDDLLSGETLLDIYLALQGGASVFSGSLSVPKMRSALDKMAAFADEHPRDGAGSLIYRPAHGETFVFADGIGLACPFLYRYGEAFGKQEYRELALLQVENFLSSGMDGVTGLPYHGYDAANGCKYGIIGWGRGVGWLLRGMMGCMISPYGRKRLEDPCRALANAVLAYQRWDGYFSWQLEALEGPADTSATGMICAALIQGMASGVLAGKRYEKALEMGRQALERSVRDGLVYDCSGECEGFSCYPQRYGAYPWSLGSALEVL